MIQARHPMSTQYPINVHSFLVAVLVGLLMTWNPKMTSRLYPVKTSLLPSIFEFHPHGGFLKWGYPISSSILIGFSLTKTIQLLGTSIVGNPHIYPFQPISIKSIGTLKAPKTSVAKTSVWLQPVTFLITDGKHTSSSMILGRCGHGGHGGWAEKYELVSWDD